jgi:protein gp37
MGSPKYTHGFDIAVHETVLDQPLKWKRPRKIFVNSMSDLFHEKVPDEFILRVFESMRKADWHQFQILTKRSGNLLRMDQHIDWPRNVWMGVSVENSDYKFRIDSLRKTHAKFKFLSLEPLLGPIPNLDLSDIDWVIVGGESGPGSSAMDEEWVVDARDQCIKAFVPFLFKQWSGVNKKKNGRLLQGMTWDQKPNFEGKFLTTFL